MGIGRRPPPEPRGGAPREGGCPEPPSAGSTADVTAPADAGASTAPADAGASTAPADAGAPGRAAPAALDARRFGHRSTARASEPAQAPEETGCEAQPGRLVADRYRLVGRLGAGAHGEVWAAEDTVVGGEVALKWMRAAGGAGLARVRREITTLRMLRVPGVVRLLDDGIEDGRPFLVMERVEGRPFPGCTARRDGALRRFAWEAIAGATLALLEVLARVHAAGIVHRDLKPENILVGADARPTVLDFGVSRWGDPGGDRLTRAGQILGTPLYLAPEQILGRAVDARTDLYAVGVMLHEALVGRAPHEAEDVQALLRARLATPAPPARELDPELPDAVAQVIDRLLATRSEDRFRSAVEVLAALRGEPAASRAAPSLPRLGGDGPVAAVIAAARAGRSLDVVGAAGSGRSRCLAEAAAALERQGRTVLWTRPARTPLASLQPFVSAREDQAGLRLAEVIAWAEGQLRAVLAGGAVVLADDAPSIDPWSAAILDRCRAGRGTVVRALPAAPEGAGPEDVARLDPLEMAALLPLFAGPDRLLHLREDGARALWERTEGLPARVDAEVTLWTRLGLARWDGGKLAVDRDALDRLGTDLVGAAPASASPPAHLGEPHLEELCGWLALAGHHLELAQLARVMGQPLWRVEGACEALLARGAARRLHGGRVALRGQLDVAWAPARRTAAHRAVAEALAPAQEGRLFHLLAADEAREGAREAAALARRRAAEGHLGAAVGALAEGLRAARQHGPQPLLEEEVELLGAWVEVAFAEGTPHALDRALYELTRARAPRAAVARLDALVRGGIAARGASAFRALELADGIQALDPPALERWRQRVRIVAAAARAAPSLLEEVIDDIQAWASRASEPLSRLCLAEGRARLRYLQGRFDEAAALHAEAAALDPWLTGRIAATLNSAAALLEAFRHREAEARAEAARDLASRCRHAAFEARAEWLVRAARHRRGEAGAPDLELCEAVGRLGVDEVEALVCLNEAAVAFSAGSARVAAELSQRSARAWRELDRPWGALLARCLALASGAAPGDGEARALAERALQCPVPGIGLQALGLLGRTSAEARALLRDQVDRLAAGIPRERWSQRMDVLSVEEAIRGASEHGAG
ncbi:protein kinase domain-containing protein [Sorangium sp. So ce406]|uniref:serine/threonine-protein kinase n=1 Tax=Sorangium sp. So ce406 TaxID=3133311 RepID=UPI003F5C3F0D